MRKVPRHSPEYLWGSSLDLSVDTMGSLCQHHPAQDPRRKNCHRCAYPSMILSPKSFWIAIASSAQLTALVLRRCSMWLRKPVASATQIPPERQPYPNKPCNGVNYVYYNNIIQRQNNLNTLTPRIQELNVCQESWFASEKAQNKCGKYQPKKYPKDSKISKSPLFSSLHDI